MQSNVNGFCPPMKTVGLQSQLSTCVFDIAKWMGANWLQWTQPRSKSCGAAHISDHSSTQSAISCLWQFCHPVIHRSWSGCVITHSAWKLSTSPRSTPDASLRWDSYATFDNLCHRSFSYDWSWHSYYQGWTTATEALLGCLLISSAICSASYMPLLGWSRALVDVITWHHCCSSFTGSLFQNVWCLNSVFCVLVSACTRTRISNKWLHVSGRCPLISDSVWPQVSPLWYL